MKLWEALAASNIGRASMTGISNKVNYARVDDYHLYDTRDFEARGALITYAVAELNHWEPINLKRTTFLYQFLLRHKKTGIYSASKEFYTTQATAQKDIIDDYEVIRHLEFTRTEIEV